MTERYISPCPPPKPWQAELLTHLMEECAEVQQRASKILRFGLLETQPGQTGVPFHNMARLSIEVGNLLCVICKLLAHKLLSTQMLQYGALDKAQKLVRYTQNEAPPTAPVRLPRLRLQQLDDAPQSFGIYDGTKLVGHIAIADVMHTVFGNSSVTVPAVWPPRDALSRAIDSAEADLGVSLRPGAERHRRHRVQHGPLVRLDR